MPVLTSNIGWQNSPLWIQGKLLSIGNNIILVRASKMDQQQTYIALVQKKVSQVPLFHKGENHKTVPSVNWDPNHFQDIWMIKAFGNSCFAKEIFYIRETYIGLCNKEVTCLCFEFLCEIDKHGFLNRLYHRNELKQSKNRCVFCIDISIE